MNAALRDFASVTGAQAAAEAGAKADIGFDALRGEGIDALQRLCGAIWTDYNLHDPGVTIFEQLVYGLTDLGYRTGFGMADYLTGADGRIDYQALALYPPEQILPPAPLTVEDFRRVLYAAVPALADVWIRRAGNGLLAVDVLAAPDADGAALLHQVRVHYARHRALGADLARVRLIRPRPFYLQGRIDTDGERPEGEVLAQILFDCGTYLSSGLSAQRLRDAIAAGHSPEQVFDGPDTGALHVAILPEAGGRAEVTLSELIGVIQKVEGVRRIRALSLVDENLQPALAIPRGGAHGSYGHLACPQDELHMALLDLQPEHGEDHGHPAPGARARPGMLALYEEARLELHKLTFEQSAFRSDGTPARYPRPVGRRRDLAAYYSVQHEFPALYGVGALGLPASASEERRAQARQLQGFLYPMEQLMANYLQNLADIPQLFGLRHERGATYGTQLLAGPAVPGVEALYVDGLAETREKVARVQQRQDQHLERKGRVYDYLLALYGESFPQNALRRFNAYRVQDTDAWLLDAKRRLLEALPVLGAGRGRGADYSAPPDAIEATPPLARRVAILLGFDDDGAARSLLPAWHGGALAAQRDDDAARYQPQPDWLPVPPMRRQASEVAHGLPGRDALSPQLFRDGALLANYRLAREEGEYLLFVRAGTGWRLLGRHGRRADAIAAAHAAVATLARLNAACEGMHVVEHILLRPRGEHGGVLADSDDKHGHTFYHARISVVLPGWTLRCADPAFRHFAQETVREHCPAHIQPGFLWLDLDEMAQFERLHDGWRAALRDWSPDDGSETAPEREPDVDRPARALKHFLWLRNRGSA